MSKSKRRKRKWKWWVLCVSLRRKTNKVNKKLISLHTHFLTSLSTPVSVDWNSSTSIVRNDYLTCVTKVRKFLHNVRVSPTCLCLQTPKWSRDFRDVIIIGCPREGCDWLVSTVTSHPLFFDQWEHSIKFTPIIPLRRTPSCKIYINLYIMHCGCLYIHLDVLLNK